MPKGIVALLTGVVVSLVAYFAYVSLQPASNPQIAATAASNDYVPPSPIQSANTIPVLVVDLAADRQFDQNNILLGRDIILVLHGGEVADRTNHSQDVYNAYQILSILTQNNAAIVDLNNTLFLRIEFLHYLGGGARIEYVPGVDAGLRALTFSQTSLPQIGSQTAGTVITAVFADGSRRQVRIIPFDANLIK